MIRLDTITRILQIQLGGVVTTNQLPVVVCFSDKSDCVYDGQTQLANTNDTTAVTICSAPAASTVRDIDYVSVYNSDTVAADVTIIIDDNATPYVVLTIALGPGHQLVYTHADGWHTTDLIGDLSGSALTTQDEGITLSTDTTLMNFVGAGVTATQPISDEITVTIPGNIVQNLWETITSDAGSAVANIPTDTLSVLGGTGISTAIVGDTLTITNDSPGAPDQNLFETFTDGVNSAIADTTTDTFTFTAGTGITAIVTPGTDTLTITNSAPNVDQNLWETITSDAGSAVANTTTDTLTIAGGTNVTTSISGDTLTIDAASSGGLSGFGLWRYRTATTATPASGQLQFDNVTIDSATELYVNVVNDGGTDMTAFLALVGLGDLIYLQVQDDSTQFVVIRVGFPRTLSAGVYTYPIVLVESQGTAPSNNTTVAFVATTSPILFGPGTRAGGIVAYHFLTDKYTYGEWLGTTTKHIPSDETHYMIPYDSELVAITYSADVTSDIDIFVETAADGAGAANSTLFNWTLADARVARNSLPSSSGGPGGLSIPKGTKLAVFTDQPLGVGQIPPEDLVVSVYLQWIAEDEEEVIEAYAGDFT